MTDMGYKVLMTKSSMYLLSSNIEFNIKKKHVKLTANRDGKLYKAQMADVRKVFLPIEQGENDTKSSSKK
jgi:hypothetical protein